MPYRGNDGSIRIENSLRHRLFIKGPKILYGTAASTYNQYIQSHLIQTGNPLTDGSYRPLSLYQGRIEEKLHKGISPLCDLDNVSNRRSGACGNNADFSGILGNRLFIHGIKKPHFLQFLLQGLKAKIEVSLPSSLKGIRINLIAASYLINTDTAGTQHLHSIFQRKSKPRPLSRKHNAGKLRSLVL